VRLRTSRTILVNSSERLSRTNGLNLWDKAIADAGELIEESHSLVRQLKKSIEMMRRLRDKGVIFPGGGLETNGNKA
jgi:hypothetical protein